MQAKLSNGLQSLFPKGTFALHAYDFSGDTMEIKSNGTESGGEEI